MVHDKTPNQTQARLNLLHQCEMYCINLDTRPDRWKNVQQQFALLSLQNVQRYAAKTDVSVRNDALTKGEHSVIETSLELLRTCHRSKPILIFQDDVYFLMECHPLDTMDKITAQLPDDFGILYLGAHLFDPKIKHPLVTPNLVKMLPEPNPTPKKDHVYIGGAHAIVFSQRSIEFILSQTEDILCLRHNGMCSYPNTWCRPFPALWPTRPLHFKLKIFRTWKAGKQSEIGLSNTIRNKLRKVDFQNPRY